MHIIAAHASANPRADAGGAFRWAIKIRTGTTSQLIYAPTMAIAINELTSIAMKLSDKQRAQLVANLLACCQAC